MSKTKPPTPCAWCAEIEGEYLPIPRASSNEVWYRDGGNIGNGRGDYTDVLCARPAGTAMSQSGMKSNMSLAVESARAESELSSAEHIGRSDRRASCMQP